MSKKLGLVIMVYRKKRGLKQVELAEKVGVASDTISRIERDVQSPSKDLLEKIADVLEVSVATIKKKGV